MSQGEGWGSLWAGRWSVIVITIKKPEHESGINLMTVVQEKSQLTVSYETINIL